MNNVNRRWGALALVGLCLASYGAVRAAAPKNPALEYGPVTGIGKLQRLASGSAGPVIVQQPSGKATFTVNFPSAFKRPPEVVITVVGGGDTPLIARLTGPSTTGGFEGILTAPYFLPGTRSATVNVNWIAVGEVNAPAEPHF